MIMDEEQSSRQRVQEEFRRRLTSIIVRSPIANETEIKEHFNICLKMYTENKISVKNAWNLKIIDYMRTVLMSTPTFQTKETLRLAGTSLDASTKVYGIRVDDVHLNVLKLASNMANTNAQQQERQEGIGQEDVEGVSQNTQQNKKRQRCEKTTVAKNPSVLIGEIPKVPSVFFCNSNDQDTNATNLLSSTLPMHYTGYKFMLKSKEVAWLNTKQNFSSNVEKKYPIKISALSNMRLCVPFEDFEIDHWDEEAEFECSFEPTGENVVYNEEGLPIPELDGTINNIFEPYVEDDANNNEEIKTIHNINPIRANIIKNDYFYFPFKYNFGNKTISCIWAGPSYWKFKYNRKNASRFSGKINDNKRKTVKKYIPQPINFSEEADPIDKTKLCKRTLITKDEDYNKCTLPERYLIDHDINRPLIIKPLYICETNTEILKEPVRDADIINFESEDTYHEESFQNDVFDNVSEHEEIVHSSRRGLFEENLINVPEMAENIVVPYALKSKRVNMKKLKGSIWKTLTGTDEKSEVTVTKENFRKFIPNYQII